MKKTCKLAFALCFITTMTATVFAQNIGLSNSFMATANTIRSDVDYSMDPRYFQEADFSNFLTYLNINADKNKTIGGVTHKGGYLDLGFAKNWNDFRFGTYYYGDLWGNNIATKEEGKNLDPLRISRIEVENSANTCTNKFGFFGGYKNFGLKLNFSIDANSSKNVTRTIKKQPDETVTETKESSSTLFSFDTAFGGSFDFSPFTLKPIISLGYLNDNKLSEDAFLMKLGTDFVFGKGAVEHTAGLLYSLRAGGSETADKKVSHPMNTITLYYRANADLGEKAEIGVAANLANLFDSSKATDKNGNVISNVFTYMLLSDVSIGVKYKAVPSQFIINTGINMELPRVISVSYPDSAIKEYGTAADCDFKSNIYLGCELLLSKGWSLDTSLNFQIGNVNNSLFNNLTLGVSYRK